jgi:hypothetical protein
MITQGWSGWRSACTRAYMTVPYCARSTTGSISTERAASFT